MSDGLKLFKWYIPRIALLCCDNFIKGVSYGADLIFK